MFMSVPILWTTFDVYANQGCVKNTHSHFISNDYNNLTSLVHVFCEQTLLLMQIKAL